jgi:hypothetical protein
MIWMIRWTAVRPHSGVFCEFSRLLYLANALSKFGNLGLGRCPTSWGARLCKIYAPIPIPERDFSITNVVPIRKLP